MKTRAVRAVLGVGHRAALGRGRAARSRMAADECSSALPCQVQVLRLAAGRQSCHVTARTHVNAARRGGYRCAAEIERAPRGNAKLDRLARRLRSLFCLLCLLSSCVRAGQGERAVVVGAVGSHKACGAEPSDRGRRHRRQTPQLAWPDSWGLVCHRLQCHPLTAALTSPYLTSPLPAARAGRSYGGVQSLHASAAASGVQ